MAEKLVKNITADYLTCSICWNVFHQPKMLECGHSFCLKCLEEYIGSVKKTKDVFDCPLCRHEYDLSNIPDLSDWTRSLAPDKISASILQAISLQTSRQNSNEEENGNNESKDAQIFVPEECACARHRDKKLEVYCSKHDVVVCSECAWREHRGEHCECTVASEVIEKRFNALKSLVAQQVADSSLLLTSKDRTAKTVASLHEDFQKSITEVEESFREVSAIFFKRIEALRIKAKETVDKDLTVVDMKQNQDKLIEEIKLFDTNATSVNPNDTMHLISDLYRTASKLQVNIQDMSEKVVSGSLMKYSEGDLNLLDAFVSSAKQTVPDEFMTMEEIFAGDPSDKDFVMVTNSGRFSDIPENVEESIERCQQFTFSAKRPDETQCMLSSAALLGTAAVVIVDHMNKKLKKFKIPEGVFLHELSLDFEPHQAATLRESSDIVVTLWDVQKLLIVSTDPVLAILRVVATDVEYLGVTSHITNRFAAASIEARRVDILDIQGNDSKSITKQKTIYQSSRRRSFPDRLTSTSNGSIVIRNRHRNELSSFSKYHDLLWSRRLKHRVADVTCFRGRVFASLREKGQVVCFREDGKGDLEYVKQENQIRNPWSIAGFKDCLVVTEDTPSDLVHVFAFF